jgi:pimeloyl-ACP methyl ester carboxylesterase
MDRPSVTAPSGAVAGRGAVSHAVVCVGDVETAYRRAGSGEPVVVLGLGAGDDAWLLEELAPLVTRARLIVPDRTTIAALAPECVASESAFASWLSGFLQGLGLDRPHVVAPARFGPELERYARTRPDELGRVAVIDGPAITREAVAGLLHGGAPPPGT